VEKHLNTEKPKKFIIKVGGSLLFEKDQVRVKKIAEFAEILKNINNLCAIVVGGGIFARTYISAARSLHANESLCDTVGIEVSRLNARLLITALGSKAFPEPIKNLEDARAYSLFNKIMVFGGFVPGQSTTSVCFEVAETLGVTDLLVLTNVDGVYEKDPRKFPDAKKFDTLTVDKLEEIITTSDDTQAAAGEYRIFDAVSIQIFKRNQINVRMVNGEKLDELKSILENNPSSKAVGTWITRK
jgi:uridylate kinase